MMSKTRATPAKLKFLLDVTLQQKMIDDYLLVLSRFLLHGVIDNVFQVNDLGHINIKYER